MSKSTSINKRAKFSIVYLLLGLFGLPFATIGIVAGLSLFRLGYDEIRMQSWTEIPCTLLSAELKDETDTESRTVRVVASYRYRVNDKDYVGNRVTTTDFASSNIAFHTKIHALLSELQKSGEPHRCFVNLSHPEQSILYRESQWQVTTLQTWIALLFTVIGVGLISIVIASWLDEQRHVPRLRNSGEAWMRRADWAAGEIQYSDRNSGRIVFRIGILIIVLSIPGLVTSLIALIYRHENLAALGLLATGLGLWVTYAGHRRYVRWWRYGNSTFQMASVPGVLGGSLAGVVRIEGHVESQDGFRLHLSCTETSRSTGGDDGPNVRTLWEDEQTIIRQIDLPDSEGTAVPVMFVLPYDAPQTNDDPKLDKQQWTLRVASLSPGTDYKAEFEVPVFRTPKSDPNYQPDLSRIEQFRAPRQTDLRFRQSGILTEQLDDGGYRFIFPRGRNLGFVLAMAIVQLIFAAAIIAAFYFKWFAVWHFAASVIGPLVLYAIVDLLFFKSEVEVGSKGLSVRSGLFRLNSPQEFATNEIKKLHRKSAGTAANVAAYDLLLETKAGKNQILAKRIIPDRIARDVIRLINECLHRQSLKDE